MLRPLLPARTLGISVVMVVASIGVGPPIPAAASAAAPLVVGVGHFDPTNQQFDPKTGNPVSGGRVWQYLDFFPRAVTVQTGATLDFRTAPNEFHVIAVVPDGPAYRANNPIFATDADDPAAPGSGAPKVSLGFGAAALFNPPSCGVVVPALPPCASFDGTNAVVAGAIGGQPLGPVDEEEGGAALIASHSVDWQVTVTAAPGSYNYLCLIHPEMNGRLNVVSAGSDTTSQKEADRVSARQFRQDHAQAQRVEEAGPTWHSDGAGHRIFEAHASAQTPNGHVGLFEMLPRNLTLQVGDSVHWNWAAGVELHTVSFPADSPVLPEPPTGIDCANGTFAPFNIMGPPSGTPPPLPCVPEFGAGEGTPPGAATPFIPVEVIFDPGNSRPGQLSDPTALVDSGVLVGADYNLNPSVQDWSAIAKNIGTYPYQCTLHDWMRGTVTVAQGDD